jgi:hypothetical protein
MEAPDCLLFRAAAGNVLPTSQMHATPQMHTASLDGIDAMA